MAKKHFYHHIANTEPLLVELQKLDLSAEELTELSTLAEETLHHMILDMILSELGEEDKKTFLIFLVEENHDELNNHLNAHIDSLDEKIRAISEEVTKMLLEDIEDFRKEN